MSEFFFFTVCPHGKFKYGTGDDRCQLCPLNSKAPDYGFAECRCNAGFYRAYKDAKTMPCTRKLNLQYLTPHINNCAVKRMNITLCNTIFGVSALAVVFLVLFLHILC